MKINDSLARYAVRCAMDSAARYIEKNKIVISDVGSLTASLRSHVMAAYGPALDDVRLALDCHMGQAAIATFDASMAVAGINAVKSLADVVTQ